MKICMIASSYPKFPGDVTAPFIEEIAANVAARGHEVHLVAPYHPEIVREPCERGVNLHFYRYAPTPKLNIWGYAESLESDVAVKKNIYALAPLVMASGLATLARLGQQIDFDLYLAHWVIPNGPLGALVAGIRRKPLVVSLHGSDVFVSERSKTVGRVSRTVFQAADMVTACSTDLRDRSLNLGLKKEAAVVIPYGIDPEEYKPATNEDRLAARHKLGLDPQAPLLIAVGRFVYKKGFTYLLNALPAIKQQFPQVKLALLGYGDLKEELVQETQRLGLVDQVLFPGAIKRDLLPTWYAAADIFTLPSIIDQQGNVDGLPNTLLEAMGSGKAIVASRVAGVPMVIKHGQNGLLVSPKDAQALGEAVIALLASGEMREYLGKQARLSVERELNWPTTAKRYEDVFQQAIENYYR